MFCPTCTCCIYWPPYLLVTEGQASTLLLQFKCFLITKLNMTDEDVATRAPESDGKEPSMLSSQDTPAQEGASMGVHYPDLHT